MTKSQETFLPPLGQLGAFLRERGWTQLGWEAVRSKAPCWALCWFVGDPWQGCLRVHMCTCAGMCNVRSQRSLGAHGGLCLHSAASHGVTSHLQPGTEQGRLAEGTDACLSLKTESQKWEDEAQ